MRTLLCSLLTALLGLSIARADSLNPEDVLGQSYWSKLDDQAKPAFLMGFRVGAGMDTFAKATTPFDVVDDSLGLRGDQIPKLIPALDAFYKDPANAAVYLRRAVQICLMQLEHRPEAATKEVLRKAREWHKQ